MTRKSFVIVICVAAMFASSTRAADPMKTALSVIPADAVGFVCVPSLKQLDGKWQQSITNLGLQPFVPPPWNSPLTALQQLGQMAEGLDANGPLIFVQMPFENMFEMPSRNAFILSAADPKALVESMGGQAAEGGIWNLTVVGKPCFAVTVDKNLIVSDTAEGVKAVADGKGGMDGKLRSEDLKVLKGLDLVLWIDGERLLKVFKPQIDGLTGMLTMMQASSGSPLAIKQAESTRQQIDMFVEGTKSATIGLSLDPAGIGLRAGFSTKPGTKLARQMKNIELAKGSLLQGLPAGKFMIAAGEVLNADQIKEALKYMDPYFEVGDEVESLNAEQLGILKGILEDWAPLNTGFGVTIEALPPGPGGVVGMSLVFHTTDSGRWLELVGKAVDALKGLLTDETGEMVSKALSYAGEAEEIGGMKVAHLKIDLAKIDEIDEDDLEEITAVLGQEGLLFRMGPVGPKVVAVSFGGGADYMKRLITHADKTEAPLENAPGIRKVAGHLPKEQASAGYVAVDQIMACIGNAAKVLDEDEEFPFRMPEINAPLAMGSTGTDGAVQMDIFFPTELVVASKDLIMSVMASKSAASPPAEPAGEIESDSDKP